MNKIKFFYDVVKVLKSKDVLHGVASAEVQKDQVKVFYVKNEFEKNLLTMQSKANIITEIDYEGKQVKHQSTTEFTNHCPSHGMHHKFFKHMHQGGGACGGIKGKLTKLAFMLNIFSNIKVEEQVDHTTLVTLDLNEIPEDMKTMIQAKMNHANDCHSHDRHCCFKKELCCIETGKLSCTMSVNQDYEIQKIVVAFDGVQSSEQSEQHVLTIVAELKLT